MTGFKNIRPVWPRVFVLNSARMRLSDSFFPILRAKIGGFANICGWFILRRGQSRVIAHLK